MPDNTRAEEPEFLLPEVDTDTSAIAAEPPPGTEPIDQDPGWLPEGTVTAEDG